MNWKQGVTIAGLLLLSLLPLIALDKKEMSERYKGKYLVVVRNGLAVGICAQHSANDTSAGVNPAGLPPPPLRVMISGDTADYKAYAGVGAALVGCGEVSPEPLHKGEVLRVTYDGFHKGGFFLNVGTVSAHQVDRGIGGMEHSSYEQAGAILRFTDCNADDADACQSQVEKWVKVFDSQDDAAKFGNTASGAFVKEVKLGMTPAEVEAALGLPGTKVDLGEKVLYKYKDMTVEFHDGKVSDVR